MGIFDGVQFYCTDREVGKLLKEHGGSKQVCVWARVRMVATVLLLTADSR